jgi:dienelactone hydrolase
MPDDHTHRRLDIREEGLVGTLVAPATGGPYPGVLVLSGSGGGIPEALASEIARHGFAALALAYFGVEDLPTELVEIPLEYSEKGLAWMGHSGLVAGDRMSVLGISKGAELALLLASVTRSVKAVAAFVPSHVVWQGISYSSSQRSTSSWTSAGEPIPYVPYKLAPDWARQASGRPIRLFDLYSSSLADTEAVDRARIRVENIAGPIVLISGGEDHMWPSSFMADQIMERLRVSGFGYVYQHLKYDLAGHFAGPPSSQSRPSVFDLGGTAEANLQAQANSWPKVLAFLNHYGRSLA